MIQIVESPTYSKSYPQPDGSSRTFDYNVVGALSTISYRFKDDQAKMLNITQQETWALLTLRENINDYLNAVATATGKPVQVYLEDTVPGVFDYTGVYRIAEIKTNADGDTQILLKSPIDESPTFYGNKEFPDDYTSQLVYGYKTKVTFNVYDVSRINGVDKRVLLATQRQQLDASGYVSFNISELAKGYLGESGGITLAVQATVTDYFGNSSEVETLPCILVQARVPELNYGTYTLFNPETGGQILPTTGYRLLYNESEVYPFYINFVTNDILGQAGLLVQLRVNMYQSDRIIDTVFVTIPAATGLNAVDLSEYKEVAGAIVKKKPERLDISVLYSTVKPGEFNDKEFTDQFNISQLDGSGQSNACSIPCVQYTLDNRRDFYFAYQNGLGGISTYLCTEFRRLTTPEVNGLRNASQISNAVARETETTELSFKYTDIRGLDFLLGYNVTKVLKYDGIYESRNVTRIGAGGTRVLWIVKPTDYGVDNADLYKDISVTVYRPIGTIYDTETHGE